MKKCIFSLLLFIALSAGALAQTISVAEDVEALAGETVGFNLHIADVEAMTSNRFVATLPEGITLSSVEATSAWPGLFSVNKETGEFSSIVSSDKALTGEGDIANVKLTVAEGTAEGIYSITIGGVRVNGVSLETEAKFNVHVVSIHSVVLDENSTTAPEASDGAVNVRVKRTINAGEWSTLCLPFSMTEEQVKAAFGDDVQLSDFDGYEATEDEDECIVGLTVKFKDADITSGMEANHPYLIKVSSDITEFKADGVDIVPEEAPTVAAVKRSKKQWSEMTGTYVANTVLEATNLFISSNKFWYSSGNTKMKAFRAYFDFYDVLTEVEDAYSSRIVFAFGDTPSDISDTMTLNSSDEKYFDLQGRRVIKPSRGMYIKNGKKEIIK